jgi:hypothetical protein
MKIATSARRLGFGFVSTNGLQAAAFRMKKTGSLAAAGFSF